VASQKCWCRLQFLPTSIIAVNIPRSSYKRIFGSPCGSGVLALYRATYFPDLDEVSGCPPTWVEEVTCPGLNFSNSMTWREYIPTYKFTRYGKKHFVHQIHCNSLDNEWVITRRKGKPVLHCIYMVHWNK
jgi:hypothetical protein